MNFNIKNKNVDSNYLSSPTFSHQSQLLVKHEDVTIFYASSTSCTANIQSGDFSFYLRCVYVCFENIIHNACRERSEVLSEQPSLPPPSLPPPPAIDHPNMTRYTPRPPLACVPRHSRDTDGAADIFIQSPSSSKQHLILNNKQRLLLLHFVLLRTHSS